MSKLIDFMVKYRVKNGRELLELFNNQTRQELIEFLDEKEMTPGIETDIINVVSEMYGVSITDLKSNIRRREIVDARATIYFLIFASTNYTLRQIGLTLFKQDHATIIHSVKKAINLCQVDPGFKNKLRFIIIELEQMGYNCSKLTKRINERTTSRTRNSVAKFKNICFRRTDFYVGTQDTENDLRAPNDGTSGGILFATTSNVII